MPPLVSDEMIETFDTVGTYDQITAQIKQRYGGIITHIEFGVPVRHDVARGQLREIIQDLQWIDSGIDLYVAPSRVVNRISLEKKYKKSLQERWSLRLKTHHPGGNEILRENGAMKKWRAPRWLDSCETLPAVIAGIKKRDLWPGIEILFNDNTKSAFYLGPITQTTDDYFLLYCYNANGRWEKEYKLKYDNLFRIELDSKYCNHINAYMRKRYSS